ncbi:hypothetical protein O1611_g8937 [Lasiodiplodia mahajangana]|uniref:Uncharacterized protein n=1 Tax=Lasiodiplodia mahajangana TaxID=1108764 RepID=A0ACC2JBH2_9PEZI|nr:hypothetical protein O1611_g8937 [Lasiodiplodia mahajangana]
MSYDKWLSQRPDVKEAVDKLNGNFQPNSLQMNVGKDDQGNSRQQMAPTTSSLQSHVKKEETNNEGKRGWWRRS